MSKYPGLSVSDVIKMVRQNPNPTSMELMFVSGLELQREKIAELEATIDHLQNWCASPEDEAAVRQAALEEACNAICGDCKRGQPPIHNKGMGKYFHMGYIEGNTYECVAAAIRKLMEIPPPPIEASAGQERGG